MPIYPPIDSYHYDQDPRARRLHRGLPDGLYVYVRDLNGDIWIAPDAAHQHPKILGGGKSVMYAGDFTIERGRITDLTNLSGTFQCGSITGLHAVWETLVQQGWDVEGRGVRFFPPDGSRPRRLGQIFP